MQRLQPSTQQQQGAAYRVGHRGVYHDCSKNVIPGNEMKKTTAEVSGSSWLYTRQCTVYLSPILRRINQPDTSLYNKDCALIGLVEPTITRNHRTHVNRSQLIYSWETAVCRTDVDITKNYLQIIYKARPLLRCITDRTFSWTDHRTVSTVGRSRREQRNKNNHGLFIVQAVEKANSQSKGNGQTSTSPRSPETPERISVKHAWNLWLCRRYNQWLLTTRANPCGAATTWVVYVHTWLVTCFGYLVDLSFELNSSVRTQSKPVDRFWRSTYTYMSCPVFPRRCLLGVALTLLPI